MQKWSGFVDCEAGGIEIGMNLLILKSSYVNIDLLLCCIKHLNEFVKIDDMLIKVDLPCVFLIDNLNVNEYIQNEPFSCFFKRIFTYFNQSTLQKIHLPNLKLKSNFTIATFAFHSHSTITPQSLHNHSTITPQSIQFPEPTMPIN